MMGRQSKAVAGLFKNKIYCLPKTVEAGNTISAVKAQSGQNCAVLHIEGKTLAEQARTGNLFMVLRQQLVSQVKNGHELPDRVSVFNIIQAVGRKRPTLLLFDSFDAAYTQYLVGGNKKLSEEIDLLEKELDKILKEPVQFTFSCSHEIGKTKASFLKKRVGMQMAVNQCCVSQAEAVKVLSNRQTKEGMDLRLQESLVLAGINQQYYCPARLANPDSKLSVSQFSRLVIESGLNNPQFYQVCNILLTKGSHSMGAGGIAFKRLQPLERLRSRIEDYSLSTDHLLLLLICQGVLKVDLKQSRLILNRDARDQLAQLLKAKAVSLNQVCSKLQKQIEDVGCLLNSTHQSIELGLAKLCKQINLNFVALLYSQNRRTLSRLRQAFAALIGLSQVAQSRQMMNFDEENAFVVTFQNSSRAGVTAGLVRARVNQVINSRSEGSVMGGKLNQFYRLRADRSVPQRVIIVVVVVDWAQAEVRAGVSHYSWVHNWVLQRSFSLL